MKSMRDRAWRRKQACRVAKKKINIAKTKCSGSHCRDDFLKFNKDVYFTENKINLTCDCQQCIDSRAYEEIDYDKFERIEKEQIKREYCEEYNFIL